MKKIQIRLFIILAIALIGILQPSAATAQQTDSASVFRTTPLVNDVCAQRLDKTLDALEKCEAVNEAKTKENAAVRQLNALNEQIISQQKAVIENQDKLIVILTKQTRRKFSLLFGLIKVTY